jgi:hypothetical protein
MSSRILASKAGMRLCDETTNGLEAKISAISKLPLHAAICLDS